MVEFAFVSLLLVLFVTGIINFGLILSFKQDVTRAAAEGARAGAVALPPAAPPSVQTSDSRHIAATTATNEAVDSFGKTCGSGGMTCEVILHDCNQVPVVGSVAYYSTPENDCVTVELTYDYDGFPLLAEPPVISGLLPDTISATSVSRLNE